MRIAVVGATGLVGREMLTVLEERDVKVTELYPVASEASVGKTIRFNGNEVRVISMEQAISLTPDFALFSAGGSTSLEWAPKFAEVGTIVIDNSSAWRMESNIPLVVPEVNLETTESGSKIIANPNCSTIQLVVALAPLHKAFGLKRVVVSTYQSVSGTGKAAMLQLEEEENGHAASKPAYKYPIHRNCIPHCDVFLENGYTKEEMKLVNESRKILGIPNLKLTATAVRVPVNGGHSEAVNVTFEKPATVEDVRWILSKADGVILQDDPETNLYPMPLLAHRRDEVFVGRIRKDESEENAFNLWIVADNLRKGAATNAVQILEKLTQKAASK
ncbi:MAG: aspartate-semialdehyde dehydrogenase [Flavobacteriales bacterium]|nr:aspartate-semialdehyde dehydrogenase [Flavobacteriales bacterium]